MVVVGLIVVVGQPETLNGQVVVVGFVIVVVVETVVVATVVVDCWVVVATEVVEVVRPAQALGIGFAQLVIVQP